MRRREILPDILPAVSAGGGLQPGAAGCVFVTANDKQASLLAPCCCCHVIDVLSLL